MQLANYYKALPPMSQFLDWLEKETDIKKIAKFDKAVEAAKRVDRDNDERASYWGELGIWSFRRLGALLKEGKEQGVLLERGRPKKRLDAQTFFTLADLDLSKFQSHRAQLINALPEKQLRQHIAGCKAALKIVTKAGLTPLFNQERKTARLKTLKEMDWPKGKYRVIYADPAWSYNDKRLSSPSGGGASG